ncbi:sigma factor-like helix-turn-helix DNA-binding protein [Demequina rhizosphaerae]|uniref:sigma factor-like helix-turn-helix DNA-binding protein n=1 Tax=Demequina rhizosphaerae TaxID=1638985 RepID=UPI00155A861D|nr:sigma factor-like helix-turn-helix DNA-binding protein [Demequina rhizosphaerae]
MADLEGLSIAEVADWRNVGLGTVDLLLKLLAEASTFQPVPSPDGREVHGADQAQTHRPGALSDGQDLGRIADDLRTLAAWRAAIGKDEIALLAEQDLENLLPEVLAARERIMSATPSEVFGGVHELPDAATLLEKALEDLDPRAIVVLGARLFADAPVTLDELGQLFGLTRERIRQIEGKARAVMLDAISEGSLGMVAEVARDAVGSLCALEDLLAAVPALARNVASASQPAWRVIDRLDDAYEIVDDWCAAPSMSAAVEATATQLRERSDNHGVARIEELELVSGLDITKVAARTRDWLVRCGYLVHGEHVLTKTRSVGDEAAGILSVQGEPMTAKDIRSQLSSARSEGSLRNALGAEDRFARVDRETWALAEWNLGEYSDIKSAIRTELARAGGTMAVDALVEQITTRYSVSARSVAAYAAAPPFATRAGVVMRSALTREARKTPQQTARLYRTDSAWLYRVRISHDHHRGSGSVAPIAIATILDIGQGESIELQSALGPQAIRWTGLQPSFGTIRRFLIELDIAVGTEVFLVISDDRTFGMELVREETGDPIANALALVGAPPESDPASALEALRHAASMQAHAPILSVIGTFRDRGDADVAELLTASRSRFVAGPPSSSAEPAPGVDEILDLL